MSAQRSGAALLTVLGVESWGPLTLLLSRDGDPAALVQRLRLAWWQAAAASGDPQPPAGQLLTQLLRDQGSAFRPLGSPAWASLPPDLAFCHRLRLPRCRRCLCLRSWLLAGAENLWQPWGAERCLDRSFVAMAPLPPSGLRLAAGLLLPVVGEQGPGRGRGPVAALGREAATGSKRRGNPGPARGRPAPALLVAELKSLPCHRASPSDQQAVNPASRCIS